MNADRLGRVEAVADEVWGEAEPGSQLEALAGALRDVASAGLKLLDAVESLKERMDAMQEQIDQLKGRDDH